MEIVKSNKAIELLESLDLKYEMTKKVVELDEKTGLSEYFDPIFYDKKSHDQVKEAIQVLSKHTFQ